MSCLSDGEVQAVVDNEAPESIRAHAASCERCRARVDERRHLMADMTALVMSERSMPPAVEARVHDAVSGVRGATTLRAARVMSWPRAGWISALATAGAIAFVVFVVLPRFGSPTTLSAAEVLGRSLQTLSATNGVELLEYDLSITGMLDGQHRIVHLIDHETPSRYKLSDFGPDGVVHSAMSQDPTAGRRSHMVRVDDRNYIINVTNLGDTLPSLPQMAQAQLESVIAMLQATSDQKLTVLDSASGPQYLIELPPIAPTASGAALEIYQARVLIDGRDFRIEEFDASGTMLRQPYSVSFRLIQQRVLDRSSIDPSDFAIEPGPNDVVIEGTADGEPFDDVVCIVLRELGRVMGR